MQPDKTLYRVNVAFNRFQRDYQRDTELDLDADLSCWGDARDDAVRELVLSGHLELVLPPTIGGTRPDVEPPADIVESYGAGVSADTAPPKPLALPERDEPVA